MKKTAKRAFSILLAVLILWSCGLGAAATENQGSTDYVPPPPSNAEYNRWVDWGNIPDFQMMRETKPMIVNGKMYFPANRSIIEDGVWVGYRDRLLV